MNSCFNVTVNLEIVGLSEADLTYLLPRMLRDDVIHLPSGDRTTLLLREHSVSRAREAVGGGGGIGNPGGNGGAPNEGSVSGPAMGYPSAYRLEARVKFNSGEFLAKVQELENLRAPNPAQNRAASHPFVIITRVLQMREIVFLHALTGKKKMLPGVPIVEYIYTELRPFGPAWFGDLACRRILAPGSMPDTPKALRIR